MPTSANQPFTNFPTDFTKLPTVSFVVPNQQNDMHDGTIQQGDDWLKGHLDSYVQWAKAHNSLLILTWDEDDGTQNNQVPTLVIAPSVKPGTQVATTFNHYSLLRATEEQLGLGLIANAATAADMRAAFVI